jgi:hypothetical protein
MSAGNLDLQNAQANKANAGNLGLQNAQANKKAPARGAHRSNAGKR